MEKYYFTTRRGSTGVFLLPVKSRYGMGLKAPEFPHTHIKGNFFNKGALKNAMDIRAFNVPEFMKNRISFARLIAPANDGPSQCWFCCIWCLVGLGCCCSKLFFIRDPTQNPFSSAFIVLNYGICHTCKYFSEFLP